MTDILIIVTWIWKTDWLVAFSISRNTYLKLSDRHGETAGGMEGEGMGGIGGGKITIGTLFRITVSPRSINL